MPDLNELTGMLTSGKKGQYLIIGLRLGTHREYRPHELRTETLFTDIQQMWGEPSIEVIRPTRTLREQPKGIHCYVGLTGDHR